MLLILFAIVAVNFVVVDVAVVIVVVIDAIMSFKGLKAANG